MSPYVKLTFEPRPCTECGQEFQPTKSDHMVCSWPCHLARKRRRMKEKRQQLVQKNTCRICGKKFIPKRPSAECCSDACKKARRREREKARVRINEPARIAKRNGTPEEYIDRPCVECGVLFKPRSRVSKCCSRLCSSRYSRKKKAEANPKVATERQEIDEMRRELGLKPLRRGIQICHRCGKRFKSTDLDHERLCSSCHKLAEVYFDPGYRHHAGVGSRY